ADRLSRVGYTPLEVKPQEITITKPSSLINIDQNATLNDKLPNNLDTDKKPIQKPVTTSEQPIKPAIIDKPINEQKPITQPTQPANIKQPTQQQKPITQPTQPANIKQPTQQQKPITQPTQPANIKQPT